MHLETTVINVSSLIHILFQTIIRLVDGKLIQTQTWEGKSTTLEREVQGGKLILVSRADVRLILPFLSHAPFYQNNTEVCVCLF